MKNNPLSPDLSPEEREIIEAAADRSTLISKMAAKDISLYLGEVLKKCYTDTGRKDNQQNDTNIVTLSIEFAADLKNDDKLSQLTTAEVRIAFYKGLLGKFGEFYGINRVSLYMFCSKYYNSEQRRKARQKQDDFLKQNQTEKLMDEQKQNVLFFNAAVRKFYEYKKSGKFNDAGNVTFDYLTILGMINLDPSARLKFKEQSQQVLLKEQRDLMDANPGLRNEINRNMASLNDLESPLIKAEAKRIALADYYQGLIDMEIDFLDLLTDKLKEPMTPSTDLNKTDHGNKEPNTVD